MGARKYQLSPGNGRAQPVDEPKVPLVCGSDEQRANLAGAQMPFGLAEWQDQMRHLAQAVAIFAPVGICRKGI